jgi:hypothetical protein
MTSISCSLRVIVYDSDSYDISVTSDVSITYSFRDLKSNPNHIWEFDHVLRYILCIVLNVHAPRLAYESFRFFRSWQGGAAELRHERSFCPFRIFSNAFLCNICTLRDMTYGSLQAIWADTPSLRLHKMVIGRFYAFPQDPRSKDSRNDHAL